MGLKNPPPASGSPDLHLSHPTPQECAQIWNNIAASWKDSLTIPVFLTESQYLTTVPLARNEGMTTWVLVDKTLRPNQREILCSCESFRKRALASDQHGKVEEGIVHGIASVYCPSEYRGRGYGTRLMREVAKALSGWQSSYGQSLGSVLYSDIGKAYYSRLGWIPNSTNGHFAFPPAASKSPGQVKAIAESELEALCFRDEAMVRQAMAAPDPNRKRVVIIPDLDHMLWHIRKEDFATNYIFGNRAEAKGAVSGRPGRQVWAIWAHRYYKHPIRPSPEDEDTENVLYILRLVVEGDETANRPQSGRKVPHTDAYGDTAIALESVLRAAQAEAARWRLDQVKLWDPSPLVQSLIYQSSLDFTQCEREEDSIASVMWYGRDSDADGEAPTWVNNEHYAWC